MSLNLDSVPNLYHYDPEKKVFKLDFTDHDMIAKSITKVDPSDDQFFAKFEEESINICGINYMGKISIHHTDGQVFDIYMPGELTYDPASGHHNENDSILVNTNQFALIIAFTCVLIKAASLCVPNEFLKKIYLITKPIIEEYYKKELLFK